MMITLVTLTLRRSWRRKTSKWTEDRRTAQKKSCKRVPLMYVHIKANKKRAAAAKKNSCWGTDCRLQVKILHQFFAPSFISFCVLFFINKYSLYIHAFKQTCIHRAHSLVCMYEVVRQCSMLTNMFALRYTSFCWLKIPFSLTTEFMPQRIYLCFLKEGRRE